MARHAPPGSLTLAALAERCGAALDGDGSVRISHVGTLESAEPGAIAFSLSRDLDPTPPPRGPFLGTSTQNMWVR